MKNTRKLIPAIAMLLVSAVMMSTASFAWFTSADVATANGMQVKAKASGGIAIGSYVDADTVPNAADFGSTVAAVYKNIAGATASIKPVSFDGTAWAEATAGASTSSTKSGDYSAVASTSTEHFLHTKWQVKSLVDDGSNATALAITNVKITSTTAMDEKLNEALRVCIVVDGKAFFFAPGRSTTTGLTFNYVKTTAGTMAQTAYGSVYNMGTETGAKTVAEYAGALIANTNDNSGKIRIYENFTYTPVTIDMYIYFEGEDTSCYTDLTANITAIPVEVEFGTVAKITSGT